MTYTLVLIKDEGKFDKWGCSLVETVGKKSFDESFQKLRLFQIAEEWMREENICPGEGYVNLYKDGVIHTVAFAGSL